VHVRQQIAHLHRVPGITHANSVGAPIRLPRLRSPTHRSLHTRARPRIGNEYRLQWRRGSLQTCNLGKGTPEFTAKRARLVLRSKKPYATTTMMFDKFFGFYVIEFFVILIPPPIRPVVATYGARDVFNLRILLRVYRIKGYDDVNFGPKSLYYMIIVGAQHNAMTIYYVA
jgi:hypothetical protein